MILRIFQVVWFFSLLAILAVFMYVYASLPEQVIVQQESVPLTLSKEMVFYIALFILAFFNAMLFVVKRIYAANPSFVSWFIGLVICMNIFSGITLAFLSVFNSGEKFDYSQIGGIVYGSVVLIVLWSLAWPIYRLFPGNSANKLV